MKIIIKSTPEELKRAQHWWDGLEAQWKMVYNEALFGKGPTLEPPKDDELILMLVRVNTIRLAGPFAYNPNTTIKLTNLSGLVPLYHLNFISISNMHIESLEELKNHVNLEHLYVYENRLQSLKGIENLRNLKNLYCHSNEITSLEPVKNLTQLEVLYVNFNKLTKFDGLTEAHADHIRQFYGLPNDGIRDKEILRLQNEIGIICRKA